MAMDGDKDKVPKMMSIETLRSTVMTNGKELGEALMEHQVEEVFADCQNLICNNEIVIEDFAKYLMNHWLNLSFQIPTEFYQL